MVAHWPGGNMVAVMEVEAEATGSYGIVTPGEDDGKLVEVKGLVEKPDPKQAPSRLGVVGRYIIEPGVFDQLDKQETGAGGEIQLTDALATRIGAAPFHGLRFSGERFDCGSKLGFLKANIAFGLARADLAEPLRDWLAQLR
jgi:UTP--glucose-1-phosphate uridylyltransferase